MSLVNEMLSDLQSNHATPVSSSSFVEPVKPNLFNKYILFVILLSTFVIIYYLLFDHFKTKQQTPINFPSIKTTANFEKIKPLKVNKVLVQAISPQTNAAPKTFPISKLPENKEKNIEPLNNQKTLLKKPPTVILKTIIDPVIKKVSLEDRSEKKLLLLLQKWILDHSNHNEKKIIRFLQKTNKFSNLWSKSLKVIIKKDSSFYKKILKLSLNYHSKNASFLYLSAKNNFSEQNHHQTLKVLGKIELNKWNKNTYKLAALSSQKVNKHNQAVVFYLKLLKSYENTGEINMAIAISYRAINLKKEAVKFYKIAFDRTDLNKLQKQFIRQQLVVLQG